MPRVYIVYCSDIYNVKTNKKMMRSVAIAIKCWPMKMWQISKGIEFLQR